MRAGKLNRRVPILRSETTRAGGGQPITQWVEHARPWADVAMQGGIGAIKADGDVSIVKASVRVRFRTDIVAGMRVVLLGTVFEVSAVLPDVKRRDHLDLVCQSIPGAKP